MRAWLLVRRWMSCPRVNCDCSRRRVLQRAFADLDDVHTVGVWRSVCSFVDVSWCLLVAFQDTNSPNSWEFDQEMVCWSDGSDGIQGWASNDSIVRWRAVHNYELHGLNVLARMRPKFNWQVQHTFWVDTISSEAIQCWFYRIKLCSYQVHSVECGAEEDVG